MARLKLANNGKKLLIGSVLAVLLVVAGLAIWIRLNSSIGSEDREGRDEAPLVTKVVEEAQTKAAEYARNNDIEGGLRHYNENIDNAQNEREKQILLVHLAYFALDGKNLDAALEAALRADDIDSTATTLTALARVYEARGEKEQALVYYKKLSAIAQPDGGGMRRAPQGDGWEDKIRELEQ